MLMATGLVFVQRKIAQVMIRNRKLSLSLLMLQCPWLSAMELLNNLISPCATIALPDIIDGHSEHSPVD